MNNLFVVVDNKPMQGNLTRIINKFEATNPIKQHGIIKNYIYVEQKRIIA